MKSGELKEPIKSFVPFQSEDGKKVIDHYLISPENGQVITAVFGLEPADLLRGMRINRPNQPLPLEEYVRLMASDDHALDHQDAARYH